MSDLGFTHIALAVTNIDASISFYAKYAQMKVVHRRTDQTTHVDVAWISDLTRPFVIVLIKAAKVEGSLSPQSHLGVAYQNCEAIDCLCNEARAEEILLDGPNDWGFPVGYWAYIRDPDGHTLEISYGQEISFTVEQARDAINRVS
ncbi:VOC family protein [Nostoc punctiforme]|uniref:Glyoxalase/bleomycin resistance protein/dioxygenase n=1 Tax=Nostoc punctiforme (strain ATCC 29133 / PCC 73102) TaxID=63737 RepID=B2IUZ1_NOSP7|nr:VOC family protein [Nostoc punctiforme]ACC84384.1 Glyoxalase/bleomycin resistance protein/dioxygenase [Nostoc punctiforme PCC 73102]